MCDKNRDFHFRCEKDLMNNNIRLAILVTFGFKNMFIRILNFYKV
jgi:hypothetical protein